MTIGPRITKDSLSYSIVLLGYQIVFFGSLTLAWNAEELTLMREVVLAIALVTIIGHAAAATVFSLLSITGPFRNIPRSAYLYFIVTGVALTALIAWACWEFPRDTQRAVTITSLIVVYWSATAAITLQGVSQLRVDHR